MTFRGQRGRRDPGPHPTLPKCEECGHHQSTPEAMKMDPLRINHWPWCSRAPKWMRDLYERCEELRALRTARRIGE